MKNPVPLVVRNLSFRYQRRSEYALRNVSFEVHPGRVILIAGSSGCGKTTLMRCINGLIPHTYHGEMEGVIKLFGKSTENMGMAELSCNVGTLLQDPERQIVSSYVQTEVAFALENQSLPREKILPRIDETLSRIGILHLRDRETFSLSGGEKQKVALAGILIARPRILLLDEPLASLDPVSAREALQLFRRLADEGFSVLIVEHRVDDVLAINPEEVLYMDRGHLLYCGDVRGLMKVVDYRSIKLPAEIVFKRARKDPIIQFKPILPRASRKQLLTFKNVNFRYGENTPQVLHDINLSVYPGDIIAILGPNGAGKTTLVKHTLGLLKPTSGQVLLGESDTQKCSVAQAAHIVGYVFQSPSQMLFADSVRQELSFGPRNLGMRPAEIVKNVEWAIKTVSLEEELETPPLALSFGQQKRISIAAVLAMRSRILMMDEPTAGQDYWNYTAFMDAILQMPGYEAVLFITHDIDLAIIYANRVLLVSDGRVIADGKPEKVLAEDDMLARSRVLPSSLLRLNQKYFHATGRYYRAETLAHRIYNDNN
ncbi:MAG: ABC transporter ATP-binding protein [Anaerolineaceae bacterium]|nr:ABC transporter ATP-binding protein [Anaerolineaceae bacterium]